MKTMTGLCTALLVLGLLCLSGIAAADTVVTDDVEPYNGPIGADSPLYGLKIALEDMDESFTANETERVDKQMEHARLRLSEVRRSLELNQSDSAEVALNNYWLKMDLANVTISRWSSNTSGLLHAQEMIVKHQVVLANLLAGNPNNTGLARAYNNSLALEEKFAAKTEIKFQRTVAKNNQTILKAIRLETRKLDRNGWPEATATVTQSDDRLTGQDKDKGNNGKGNAVVTTVTTQAQNQMQVQGGQSADKGSGNAGDKGKGSSKNK
jgi:hypothetical protein